MINSKLFYYKKLVRENIVYVASFFLSLVIFGYLGLIYSRQYWQTIQKINVLKKRVAVLKERKQIIESYRLARKKELDQFDRLLMSLIPAREDFFSIINSLEQLSQKTGFQIVSYKINFNQPRKNFLSITIAGEGDKDKFISFLREYNFSGGRLITINRISFSEKEISRYQANLTFYHSPVKVSSRLKLKPIAPKDYRFLEMLKNKLSFVLVADDGTEGRNNGRIDYPTNPNPF